MKRFFLSDAFFGVALSFAVLFSWWSGTTALETLELKFYDFRAQFRENIAPPDEVAIIAIDDDSLAQLGRWPWPRSRVAQMLAQLSSYGPKVVGLNILFSEPERNPALAELDRLKSTYQVLVSSRALIERDPANPKLALKAGTTSPLLLELDETKHRLDEDAKLASALEGRNVILPLFFDLGSGLGGKLPPLPDEVSRSAMVKMQKLGEEEPALAGEKATIPLILFSSAAAGIGHVNVVPDQDGTVRRVLLAVKYADVYYPYYGLELLRAYLGLNRGDVKITPGDKIQLGKVEAPIDASAMMLITYRGPEKTFHYYSFFDVLNNKVSPDLFKDKIVLLGPTAVGVGTQYVTPVSRAFPSVEIVANVIENLLHKKFLSRPPWSPLAELGLLLFVALFVTFGLPRLKAAMGAVLSGAMLLSLLGAGTWLFVARSEWLRVTYPAFLLAVGYIVIVTKRFLMTEKRKELVEASQIETNKMLGLSFQGQGMLDLSFEKFRACPLDETLSDLLYNLGLDFERKRQYNKAVAVYEYIATKFPKYKDIPAKLDTLKRAAEGAVFGGAIGKSKDATIMAEGAGMKPTLGRYTVEKELGRGAMGIVYLGKDPKINRQVAIKTMMFEAEGTPEQMKELKERFFREAESAGNLNHPNIVRIFDAGEEAEICFIAMELLEGHDLKKYTDKANMLPLETVIDYCAKTAEGLDFAHAAGVVHRDIKPANIMLLKDGTLRITDFGIARIQASSKTATGTVMGTPSYMSPEQVAGKKVDGRADLWSLGVMLFEMSSGEKPFKGGEAIGTLLFQIANDPHPAPTSIRPDLPSDLVAVIDRCLKKNPDERYQRGGEIAADLRKILERMKSGTPPPKPPAPGPPPKERENAR